MRRKKEYRLRLVRKRLPISFVAKLAAALGQAPSPEAYLLRRWNASPLDGRRHSRFLRSFKRQRAHQERRRIKARLARFLREGVGEDGLYAPPRRGEKEWEIF